MKAYLLQRILAIIPLMLVVATVAVVLIHLAPGDPAGVIAGPYATQEDIAVASGSWGGRRPSLADYVTVTGPADGTTTAGGRGGQREGADAAVTASQG